jgi:hypothetical protein
MNIKINLDLNSPDLPDQKFQIDQTLIQFCSVIKKYIADYRSVFPFSGYAIARIVVLQVKISPLIHNMFILHHMATFHHTKDIITLKSAYVLFIRSLCTI